MAATAVESAPAQTARRPAGADDRVLCRSVSLTSERPALRLLAKESSPPPQQPPVPRGTKRPNGAGGRDSWFCFLVVQHRSPTGEGRARPLLGVHVARDPFAYVAKEGAGQDGGEEEEESMEMERLTEVPFWRDKRRGDGTGGTLEWLAALRDLHAHKAENAATEIARMSRGDSRSLLRLAPGALPPPLHHHYHENGKKKQQQQPLLLPPSPPPKLRLAMVMGPMKDEQTARVARYTWLGRAHESLAGEDGNGDEDALVRAAEWGELIAAWFRLELYSDLVVIFDARSELRHHVLQQTSTGELWLVEREKETRARKILEQEAQHQQQQHQ
jgi:hypothetical protein